MNIQIFGSNKCFDTKKAIRYFKERRIKFQLIDILDKGISKGEYRSVSNAVGGMDVLINEKSKDYPMLNHLLKDQKEQLLIETPSIFNTPIVRNGRQATVGYKPEVWKSWN
ncbi:Regulatory protein Spx [Candidatus Izimaplasma bacterium HR1]|jgi:arsenate reductase-like glutaredoxin family protein|uniref:arsenate reductase family protein n=1 Tax=Candidatus Izimoplasma sp. HR1 TaxID=1541959 RepID=UPI0004F7FA64|nr:Regulatory protein Spx [Candidatus Izimaplasma bacterium HR1]